MAAADDDDVKAVQVFIHGVIAQARAGTEVSPARPSWPRRETRLTPSLAFAHADTPACPARSEEHTSELQSLMRISYAVFCLKKKNKPQTHRITRNYESQLT